MNSIHTLHILNKMPEHPRSTDCQRALQPGDALLLIESAVLAIATSNKKHKTGVPVFALAPDVGARGLDCSAGAVTLVDFPAIDRKSVV